MATLREMAGFDAEKFIGMQQAGQKQRTLSELGQRAAAGDYRGAQAAAFEGGETELGMRMKAMNDDDKQRLVSQAASWAYTADTPEKWEAGRQQWLDMGYDIGPHQSRDTLLAQAMTLQDRITQSNADRTYAQNERKIAADGPGGGVFGTPIFVEGPNGPEISVITKSGGSQLVQQPEGYRVMGPGQKSFATTAGKLSAEASAKLPADLSNAEKTVRNIDELSVHEGLDSILGQFDQYRGAWTLGEKGNDALGRLDQLQGGAFMQAYGMLKGGGQITQIEGLKAEQAVARMSRAQSPEVFKQALKDFRAAVNDGAQKLRDAAGSGGYAPMQPGENPAPDAEGWQTLSNGVKIRQLP